MKLSRYNGDNPPEIYLIQVQLAAQFNNWSAEETAVQVTLALECKALQILTDLQPQERLVDFLFLWVKESPNSASKAFFLQGGDSFEAAIW